MTQNSRKQAVYFLLVLGIPETFLSSTLFATLNFQKKNVKSKSINLTSYFNTLIFKIRRFQMGFRIIYGNFHADR